MRQSVLLLEFDLFDPAGGGAGTPGALIGARPDLDFHYFRRREGAGVRRPANAHALPLAPGYGPPVGPLAPRLQPFVQAFRSAMDLAWSVSQAAAAGRAPRRFDGVEAPDTRSDLLFIRQALQAHGIGVGWTALRLEGGPDPDHLLAPRTAAEAALRERLQHRAADIRYGWSEALIARLERRRPLGINYLDPVTLIRPAAPTLSPAKARPPDVVLLRQEGAPALAVGLDALWWAPPDSYRALRVVGPTPELDRLEGLAQARGLAVQHDAALAPSALQSLVRDRTVLVSPSGRDRLDLAALGALLDGCPVLVARGSGLAHWIEQRLPDARRFIGEWTHERRDGGRLHEIARDYDGVRAALVEALTRADVRPDGSTLQDVYLRREGGDARAQAHLAGLAAQFMLDGRYLDRRGGRGGPRARADRVAGSGLALAATGALRTAEALGLGLPRTPRLAFALAHPLRAAERWGERRLRAAAPDHLRGELHLLASRPAILRQLAGMGERTGDEVARKIALLQRLAAGRQVDRVRWTGELARLERGRGQLLEAARHQLRILGWLGADRFQALPQVVADLNAAGYAREAQAAQALYSDPAVARERAAALISDQRARWRRRDPRPWRALDDRRPDGAAPKVSVIATLESASGAGLARLPALLRMLEAQSLIRAGAGEVILVGACLHAPELPTLLRGCGLPPSVVVQASADQGEGEASLWNRAVQLARGEHLALFRTEEGLRPDGLERLSRVLDRTPEADWVMGDALVCEVDRRGVFQRDLVVQDRDGSRQAFCYLDPGYLGHLGGLYRRSLHDRFGWYDEDFRVAAATEFTLRILPYILTVRTPERLAVASRFPGEAAGSDAGAEIEGLRAWRLHRSEAGIEQAFAAAPEEEVAALLLAAFDHRRCAGVERRTDFELALGLARHLQRRSRGAVGGSIAQALAAIIADLRELDLWRLPQTDLRAQHRLASLGQRITRGAAWAAARLGGGSAAGIWNDERYLDTRAPPPEPDDEVSPPPG